MARNKKGENGGKSRGKEKKRAQNYPRSSTRTVAPSSRSNQTLEGASKEDPYQSLKNVTKYAAADRNRASFTMRDVAFNAEHRGRRWSSGVNLRNKAIGFVRSSEQQKQENATTNNESKMLSAGCLERDEGDHRKTQGLPAKQKQDKRPVANPPFPRFDDVLDTLDGTLNQSAVANDTSLMHECVDVSKARENIRKNHVAMPPSSPSPSPSTSGDEVVFSGRNPNQKIRAAEDRPKSPNGMGTDASCREHGFPDISSGSKTGGSVQQRWHDSLDHTICRSEGRAKYQERATSVNMKPEKPAWDDTPDDWVHRCDRARKHAQSATGPERALRRQENKKRGNSGSEPIMDQAEIEDYINNMEISGTIKDQFSNVGQQTKHTSTALNGWTHEDLKDFDNLSTSDEVLETVSQVLSKRQRPSGLQYLVVWAGEGVDEARWTLRANLNVPGAHEMIQAFEEQEESVLKRLQSSDETDEETGDGEENDEWEDEWEDEDEDFEDERDEADLIERKQESMTDERIARLFAKQEELGINSDDIVIFDDDEDLEDGGEQMFSNRRPTRKIPGGKQRGRNKAYRHDPLVGVADSAPIGDDYGDFDVLDWEAPSLSAHRRRHGDIAAFGVSDPDLEKTLSESWAMDRRKKQAKKQEREGLRAHELVGKNGKPKAMSGTLFIDGLDLEQIRDGLEDFLESDSQQ